MSKDQTRKAIIRSFLRLLNSRPVDKISIKDIVTDCCISRNTFYYHYRDIYALLMDAFEQEAQRILETTGTDRWQDALICGMYFARENRRTIYHIYNSMDRDQLERYLFRISGEMAQTVVETFAKDLLVSPEDLQFITGFYKHGVVGLLEEWLQNDMRAEPEPVVHRMAEIFRGTVRIALEQATNT